MTERSRAATPSPPADPLADAAAAEPEEPRKGSRRLIRWVAVIVGIILAVLACWQDPLYAL